MMLSGDWLLWLMALSLFAWLYLVLGRDGFWHAKQLADPALPPRQRLPETPYVLLTDADLEHDRGNLRRIVAKAEAGRLDLVSLVVGLRCEHPWERLLSPPFIF